MPAKDGALDRGFSACGLDERECRQRVLAPVFTQVASLQCGFECRSQYEQ
jgi:hypothetical protein